jgi:hypothetical protein
MATEPEKKLYAIAYEYRLGRGRNRKWCADIDYLHATDAGDARLQYLNSEPPQVMREVRIVGIAPVLGYFVNDNHGEKLSV